MNLARMPLVPRSNKFARQTCSPKYTRMYILDEDGGVSTQQRCFSKPSRIPIFSTGFSQISSVCCCLLKSEEATFLIFYAKAGNVAYLIRLEFYRR